MTEQEIELFTNVLWLTAFVATLIFIYNCLVLFRATEIEEEPEDRTFTYTETKENK